MKRTGTERMHVWTAGLILTGLLLAIALGSGCANYREWRDKKAAEAKAAESPATATTTTGPAKKKVNPDPAVARPPGSIGPAILVVNRDYITSDEVIRRIRPQLQSTATTYSDEVYQTRAEEMIQETIRDMVSETVLYQEIAARISEEQNPAVEKAVDKEVNNIATLEAGGSKIVLDKMLAEQGSTMDDLRKQLRKQIVTQQYLREKMKPKVIVTRDDMWEYYQGHREEFSEPASVHLLLIEFDPAKYLPRGTIWDRATSQDQEQARARARRQVQAAVDQLAAKTDFARVARELSTASNARTGGDMGWISRGSYRLKALEDAAFALEPGLIGRPIEIDGRTFILKVVQAKPERTVAFPDAQDRIRNSLEQEIYRKLVLQHLAKLWDKAQIGAVDPFLQEVFARLPSYEAMRAAKKPSGKEIER